MAQNYEIVNIYRSTISKFSEMPVYNLFILREVRICQLHMGSRLVFSNSKL